MRKTRGDLLAECTAAAVACYNYYADKPLDPKRIDKLKQAMGRILPERQTTKRWSKFAATKETEYAAAGEASDD